jgi:hypothetical protein
MASNTVDELLPQPNQQQQQADFKSRPRAPSHGAMQEPHPVQLQNFDLSNRPDAASSTADSSPKRSANCPTSQCSDSARRKLVTRTKLRAWRLSFNRRFSGRTSAHHFIQRAKRCIGRSSMSRQIPHKFLSPIDGKVCRSPCHPAWMV